MDFSKYFRVNIAPFDIWIYIMAGHMGAPRKSLIGIEIWSGSWTIDSSTGQMGVLISIIMRQENTLYHMFNK